MTSHPECTHGLTRTSNPLFSVGKFESINLVFRWGNQQASVTPREGQSLKLASNWDRIKCHFQSNQRNQIWCVPCPIPRITFFRSLFVFTSRLYKTFFFSAPRCLHETFKHEVKRVRSYFEAAKNYKIVKHREPVLICRKLQTCSKIWNQITFSLLSEHSTT